MCSRCRNPQSYWVDQYPRYEIASGKYLNWVRRWCSSCSYGKFKFIPVEISLPQKDFQTVRYQYKNEQAKENLSAPTTRAGLSEMTKTEVRKWLASQGFRGNTVNLVRKHELVARAEGVWDYLARPQDLEAELHLQEIFNDRQTYSNKANSSKVSQPLEQRRMLDEDSISSTKSIIVTGTEIEPQDLSFLDDIDLSSFPNAILVFGDISAMEAGLVRVAGCDGTVVVMLP